MAVFLALQLVLLLVAASPAVGQGSPDSPAESGNVTDLALAAQAAVQAEAEAEAEAPAGDAAANYSQYSEADALHFAFLAQAAMCHDIGRSWDCGPCREAPGMESVRVTDDFELSAHAYVGKSRGQCVVAFRGTDYAAAWMQDLKSIHLVALPDCSHDGWPCLVGEGFLEDYLALAPGIKSDLTAIGCTKDDPVTITGHSLGGALATLALYDFKRSGYNVEKVYTFGQPRVGDAVFARAFAAAAGGVPLFRVTKYDDPVVQMPPRGVCQHVGAEVYFWDTYASKRCAGSEDMSCAIGRRGSLFSMTLKCVFGRRMCGHTTYFPPQRPFTTQCRTRSWVIFP